MREDDTRRTRISASDSQIGRKRALWETELTHVIKPMPRRLPPPFQESIDFSGIVLLSVFEAVGGLRVQKSAARIQNKEMRVIRNSGIVREERLVRVFFAEIDFDHYIVSVEDFLELGMGLKRSVHDVAIDAPIATDFQQDSPVGSLGFGDGILKILGRISRHIIDGYRFVT